MYWRDLINFNTISNKLLRTIVLMVLSISNFNSGLTSHIPMDDIKRNEKDFDNLKQKSLISSLGTAYESFHSSLLKLPRNHYSASLLAPSTLKQKEYKTNGNFETHSTSGNSLLNVDSLTTNVNLSKKYSLFASHHNEHLSNSHLSNIAVPHRVVDLGNTYEENSLYTNTSGEGAKESAFNAPMYFGTENSTVIATQIGATAHIPCTVHHIGDCMVSWIRKKDYHLLTVGLTTYSSDERFSATHLKRSEDWTLQIKFVQQRDAGIYECQVSTHPPTSIFLHLLVVEARAEISGPPIRYLTPGSTLRLQCLVVQNTENSEYIFWYHDNRMINYDVDRGINVSTEPDFQSSELTISRTRREHSGNYTCVASNTQPASVLVHIFKGDNPAAMYHGHVGSSTKSYQTYLIHTVLMIVAMTYRSYVKRKFFL